MGDGGGHCRPLSRRARNTPYRTPTAVIPIEARDLLFAGDFSQTPSQRLCEYVLGTAFSYRITPKSMRYAAPPLDNTLNDSSRQNIEQSDNSLIPQQNLMIDAYRATAHNARYTPIWRLIVVRRESKEYGFVHTQKAQRHRRATSLCGAVQSSRFRIRMHI